MKQINNTDYFASKNYISFLIKKVKNGDGFRFIHSLYMKIRKLTLISAIVRISAITVSLLEKSAVLLLIATVILLALPVIILGTVCYLIACVTKYFILNKEISGWLDKANKITFFITKERVLSNPHNKLFENDAVKTASDPKNAVVIVCRDPFLAAKWHSPNVLAVREDYFFILRQFYIGKKHLDPTYIVL